MMPTNMSDLSEWRWRAFALELFPELRNEIKHADSAHGVFFELLPAIRERGGSVVKRLGFKDRDR